MIRLIRYRLSYFTYFGFLVASLASKGSLAFAEQCCAIDCDAYVSQDVKDIALLQLSRKNLRSDVAIVGLGNASSSVLDSGRSFTVQEAGSSVSALFILALSFVEHVSVATLAIFSAEAGKRLGGCLAVTFFASVLVVAVVVTCLRSNFRFGTLADDPVLGDQKAEHPPQKDAQQKATARERKPKDAQQKAAAEGPLDVNDGADSTISELSVSTGLISITSATEVSSDGPIGPSAECSIPGHLSQGELNANDALQLEADEGTFRNEYYLQKLSEGEASGHHPDDLGN